MTDPDTDGPAEESAATGRGGTFELPSDWRVEQFERGEYGPDDVDGLAATYELGAEDGDGPVRVSVDPVTYRRERGDERIRGIVSAFDYEWFNPEAEGTVPRRGVFAVRYDVGAAGRPKEGIFGLFVDAVDALAVALALASRTDGPRVLREHVRNHDGQSRGHRIRESDAEALQRRLAGVGPDPTPERCPFTGNPTSGHSVELPVRYAAAVGAYPRTDRGMVRVAHRSAELRATVSHGAWTDRGMGRLAFDLPGEAVEARAVELDEDVATAIGDADPGALVLATF